MRGYRRVEGVYPEWGSGSDAAEAGEQGYLAHKKLPPP